MMPGYNSQSDYSDREFVTPRTPRFYDSDGKVIVGSKNPLLRAGAKQAKYSAPPYSRSESYNSTGSNSQSSIKYNSPRAPSSDYKEYSIPYNNNSYEYPKTGNNGHNDNAYYPGENDYSNRYDADEFLHSLNRGSPEVLDNTLLLHDKLLLKHLLVPQLFLNCFITVGYTRIQ